MFSLRDRIKNYKRRIEVIAQHLKLKPDDWGIFQSEFNMELNGVFKEILEYVKKNQEINNISNIKKLHKIFDKRFKKIFLKGYYNNWSFRKPYGYSGDFEIIDEIYLNNPKTNGIERLFDNYFQMASISVAVRNRKEDFKKIIYEVIDDNYNAKVDIMNLACGPCREIKEVIDSLENSIKISKVSFDCYDNEIRALEYAKKLLNSNKSVSFFKVNALKLALTNKIEDIINKKYNLIYSTGLFDYLNHKISVKLIKNLRKLLKENGKIAISNVRDKFSNPSVFYMEWVGNWKLVYRNDEEFKSIFLEAGFKEDQLRELFEQQGIMKYIIANNGI